MLIDTHTHLNFADYGLDVDAVIKRAVENGVTKIICASSNLRDSEESIKLAQKYSGIVYATVGIHPQQTDPENNTTLKEQIDQAKKLVDNKEVVAIGECGLDFSLPPPGEKERSKEDQIFLFNELIKLNFKTKLPLLIHSRESFIEIIDLLSGYKNLQGVFHCYSGGKKGIIKVQNLGLLFGVDGNLTYDEGLQNIFKLIPLEQILLETDSPYLTPVPFRGQRNEPANIKFIAKKLTEIKETTLEEVSTITSTTTTRLFGL